MTTRPLGISLLLLAAGGLPARAENDPGAEAKSSYQIETGDSTLNVHVQERDVIYVPAVEPKR